MVDITVEETTSRETFEAASGLYLRVFEYSPKLTALNPLLLKALVANGGTAVAATADHARLIGFAYGFPGRIVNQSFAYSQAIFVDPAYQGVGLGRRLKLAQRDQALRLGFDTMRWAFDPMLARNAHFNLEVLGARGVGAMSAYYGSVGTDRLILEWDLTTENMSRPAETPPNTLLGWGISTQVDDDTIWVTIPSEARALSIADRREVSARLVRTLTRLDREGYRVVGCRRVASSSFAYLLKQKPCKERESDDAIK